MDRRGKDRDALSSSSSFSRDSHVFESASTNNAKLRSTLVEWLNDVLPDMCLPINASDEELRSFLIDGSILCRILDKLKPGSLSERGGGSRSSKRRSDDVQRFLSAMDGMGFSTFQAADLEKGSMEIVLDCLLTLKTHFTLNDEGYKDVSSGRRLLGERIVSPGSGPREEPFRVFSSPPFGEDTRKLSSHSKSLRASRSPLMKDPSTEAINYLGRKFHEVFQLKQGSYTDLSAAKISEMMKSNGLDNAPTQSLLCVVNGILDESIDMKNGEIPHRVAGLLRKVVQEIERRICTQGEHLRTQSNLFKAREVKYQSRIKVLEALATGTSEESQETQSEKNIIEDKKKVEEPDIARLMKEKDDLNREITTLRQDLKTARRSCDEQSLKLRVEAGSPALSLSSESRNTANELDDRLKEALSLLTESENKVKELEVRMKETLSLSSESRNRVHELENKLKEALSLQTESENRGKELETRLKETLSSPTESRNKVQELEYKLKEALSLQTESENRGKELETRLKETLSLPTESRNKVQELEYKLKEALSFQAESENRGKELETRLKETLSLPTESRNKVQELEDKLKEVLGSHTESGIRVKELEQKLKQALSLHTESENRVNELEGRLKETLRLPEELRNRVLELEDKLEDALSSQTESGNRVNELEDRLKGALSLQTESGDRVMELEDRLKETLSLLTESRNRVKELEDRLKEALCLQTESRNKVKELEAFSESISEQWSKKKQICHVFTESQLGALRDLRLASKSIQQEILKTQKSYSEEFGCLGSKIRVLDVAVKNYHSLLAENQKLHNELMELKGNIRVYCRVRPFLPGQKGKQSIVEYASESGELIVLNPSKQGKEGRRSFKFNKVYDSTATQEDVFTDIQPLIQSVLDGYNVCIFAYGQTGSGKTYTMTGPDAATEKEWGVNYRALNNLFRISQSRQSNFKYEISVQMVEIYNEQVRDLLSSDATQKRLAISTQSSGLAVPDATIRTVTATSDVLELMDIGLNNRAKSSTALNERSSRSHSVVSIHAHGIDLKSGSSLRGSLHLVDLAGSERVDRSEVTGDRLKEAQHINKSLSALGDVIFALAQKSPHVPYRNSKLTQVLQSSLGGQAKTLMFVQLNPDSTSYSESMSTLKFAERVSGIELGAAKSSKDGKDVRDLMEQVASLKDTIAKKDEEIETLQAGV